MSVGQFRACYPLFVSSMRILRNTRGRERGSDERLSIKSCTFCFRRDSWQLWSHFMFNLHLFRISFRTKNDNCASFSSGWKCTARTIKILIPWNHKTHLHVDSCAPTPVPTHGLELCVPLSCRRPEGFAMSCVRVRGRPCDVATACEAPRRTNERAKASVWNSGGVVVYPAAR